MAKLRQFFLSIVLMGIAAALFLSILFYHVSAVKVYERDQQNRFIKTVSDLHGLTSCSWISETVLLEKVITLKCQSPVFGARYYHFNEKHQILGQLNPNQVDFNKARSAFRTLTGLNDFKITLTYYKQESVYWVTSKTQEWLLRMQDLTILWKVDKAYD